MSRRQNMHVDGTPSTSAPRCAAKTSGTSPCRRRCELLPSQPLPARPLPRSGRMPDQPTPLAPGPCVWPQSRLRAPFRTPSCRRVPFFASRRPFQLPPVPDAAAPPAPSHTHTPPNGHAQTATSIASGQRRTRVAHHFLAVVRQACFPLALLGKCLFLGLLVQEGDGFDLFLLLPRVFLGVLGRRFFLAQTPHTRVSLVAPGVVRCATRQSGTVRTSSNSVMRFHSTVARSS